MLFPYHLADIIVKGLRVTPFNYYIDMLEELMKQERSYDTLPNFTAADCEFINNQFWLSVAISLIINISFANVENLPSSNSNVCCSNTTYLIIIYFKF